MINNNHTLRVLSIAPASASAAAGSGLPSTMVAVNLSSTCFLPDPFRPVSDTSCGPPPVSLIRKSSKASGESAPLTSWSHLQHAQAAVHRCERCTEVGGAH